MAEVARMPTVAERDNWNLLPGVPVIDHRRIVRDDSEYAVYATNTVLASDQWRLQLHFLLKR